MTVVLFIAAVLAAFVGLLVSIALHEAGHMVPAKRFGVKVPQYMIGFGRTVKSWRIGETEYGFKWLLLGGYVRLIGMFPPGKGEDTHHLRDSSTGLVQTMDARNAPVEVIAPEDADRVFYKLPVHRKIIVMFGGPFMNLVIAAVLLTGMTVAYANPLADPSTTTVSTVQDCVKKENTDTSTCTAKDPKTPAHAAGLKPGDRVVSFDGQPVSRWIQVRDAIRADAGRRVPMVVDRGGRRITLHITPMKYRVLALDADGKPVMKDGVAQTVEAGFVGVSPAQDVHPGSVTEVPGVIWHTFTGTVGLVLHLPQKMAGVVKAAFSDAPRDPNGPIGLVGVGRIAGEVGASHDIEAGAKVYMLVNILASLNMALFVFNLLPLLPLDGGHIAAALWEGLKRQVARVRRQPNPGYVDARKALWLIYGVIGMFIAMSLMLLYADIVKPIRLN